MTHITLAVDGLPATEAAVRWTARRAASDASSVHLVSVATDDGPLRAAAEAAVRDAASSLRRLAPDVHVTASTPGGNVFDTLLDVAEEADLLVVGSDRPNPLSAALHATLPMRLAGRVGSDLAIVPAAWYPEGRDGVVVGWSSDPAGAAALAVAADEAQSVGSPLTIVHGWQPMATSAYDAESAGALIAAQRDDAESTLREAREMAERRHPSITVTTIAHAGSVAGGLLTAARAAALVVVGRHRRSAVGEILFGATGDELIAAAREVPVLVVAGLRPPSGKAERKE